MKISNIGMHTTKEGRSYDLQFILEEKIAQAVGPLPPAGTTGARGIVLEIDANSETEAISKLTDALDTGDY
ncbi:MAG: hypothetical protein JRJ85_13030 [Deltaproteobacteria bacterium]|nr:hypothetical protein [Deltaproteobacteria bacterium]